MARAKRVVAVGASAGGLEALVTIAGSLPPGLEAPLFVIVHTSSSGGGLLPQILSRSGPLPAVYAADGAAIEAGRIYVAPPDLHMLLSRDSIHLTHGPKENGFRPAIDPLFRTAAEVFEERAIGIVLSGGLSDGAAGLRAIKKSGGFAIVQDPDEAPFQSMPASAIEMGPVDYTLPAREIGPALVRLVRLRMRPPVAPDRTTPAGFGHDPATAPSAFTCPECHGVLWEVPGATPQFRCRVGHSFSITRLIEAQDEDLERALWAAVRSMEEGGSLARRLAEDAGRKSQQFAERHFLERARDREKHAAVLRRLLLERAPKGKVRKIRVKPAARRAR